MFVNLYYTIASFLDFLGVQDFLALIFPYADQLASIPAQTFFYVVILIVAMVWALCFIVSLAVRFVSFIMGVILRA